MATISINVTVVGPANVITPSLPAAQPAKYTMNGQTIRPLGHENDKGFALINALNTAQRKRAVLNYEVNDLVPEPGADRSRAAASKLRIDCRLSRRPLRSAARFPRCGSAILMSRFCWM